MNALVIPSQKTPSKTDTPIPAHAPVLDQEQKAKNAENKKSIDKHMNLFDSLNLDKGLSDNIKKIILNIRSSKTGADEDMSAMFVISIIQAMVSYEMKQSMGTKLTMSLKQKQDKINERIEKLQAEQKKLQAAEKEAKIGNILGWIGSALSIFAGILTIALGGAGIGLIVAGITGLAMTGLSESGAMGEITQALAKSLTKALSKHMSPADAKKVATVLAMAIVAAVSILVTFTPGAIASKVASTIGKGITLSNKLAKFSQSMSEFNKLSSTSRGLSIGAKGLAAGSTVASAGTKISSATKRQDAAQIAYAKNMLNAFLQLLQAVQEEMLKNLKDADKTSIDSAETMQKVVDGSYRAQQTIFSNMGANLATSGA